MGLPVVYRGDFDLGREVGAIVDPLAVQVSQLKNPLAARRRVGDVADAVCELLSTVVGLLAESKYLDQAATARTVQLARDLARRPREPQISDDDLVSGRWAAVLVSHVTPCSADLAALLGRARRPGHSRSHLPAAESASERLVKALAAVDIETRLLERAIPVIARHQALPSLDEINAGIRARAERERADRALAKMKGRPR